MYKAISLLENYFQNEKNLKCEAHEIGDLSLIDMGFTANNLTFKLRFISSSDKDSVKCLTDNIAHVPENKRPDALELLNALNSEYKFLKFTMDKSGNICAQYDLPLCITDNLLEESAFEIVIRTNSIIDDAYPKIMKVIWGA